MECRPIDLQTYPRRAHFEYFRTLAFPYVGMTVQVDVTELEAFCKSRGCSFYLTFLHAVALAANRVPEFRLRIRGEGIVAYDTCGTSHIELLPDSTYCYCTLYHHLGLEEYLAYAQRTRRACREQASIEDDDETEGLYFISTVPWLHYTSLTQPVACGSDSNPRFTWGKFEADWRGRLMMPLTVQVHHALMDGVHIGAFYRCLEEELVGIVRM